MTFCESRFSLGDLVSQLLDCLRIKPIPLPDRSCFETNCSRMHTNDSPLSLSFTLLSRYNRPPWVAKHEFILIIKEFQWSISSLYCFLNKLKFDIWLFIDWSVSNDNTDALILTLLKWSNAHKGASPNFIFEFEDNKLVLLQLFC